jgi:tetratricopeptide (TPR) repeat protein
MVSPVARCTLAMLAGIVAVGAVPAKAFPQSPAKRLPADDDSKRITDAISAAQATGGPRSPDLIDPLTELAGLFEAEGDHALAIAALEEARHVVRTTYGLHTLDQLHLIEQALENQRALGAFAMVQALEERLFDLAARHPDDLRTVAIHRNIGERRMDLLRRFLASEYPAEIYGELGLFSVYPDGEVMTLLSEAQIHYADAVAVLLRNRLYSSDELRDLEMKVVRAADLVRQRNRLDNRSVAPGARRMDRAGLGGGTKHAVGRRVRGVEYISTAEELRTRTNTLWDLAPSESSEEAEQRRYRTDRLTNQYELARESYRRLIDYAEAVSESAPTDESAWRSRLEAYLQLADWDVVHSMNGIALDEYAQVHELLEANDFVEPRMAEIFAPPIPIVLPTFLPNPLETPTSARYIDVTFEVTKYGESRRIEIVGAAPGVTDAEKDDLASLVMGSRFRPRVTDGELGRAAPVAVRYYLND